MNRTAKKIMLSILVIAAFIGYTLAIRNHKDDGGTVAASNKSAASSSAPAANSSESQPQSGTAGSSSPGSNSSSGKYKNGTYTGSVADAFYGNIKVQAVISGGKITDVQFLQYPNDNPNSISINQQAMPMLKQEAVQAQSASVDTVTGATDTSRAFVQSLSAALTQAKA